MRRNVAGETFGGAAFLPDGGMAVGDRTNFDDEGAHTDEIDRAVMFAERIRRSEQPCGIRPDEAGSNRTKRPRQPDAIPDEGAAVRNLLRRSSLGLVLAGLHSVSVLWAWRQVVASPGLFSGLHWLPVAAIDFPLTTAVELSGGNDALGGDPTAVGLTYLIAGGVYWLLIGFAAQAACRRYMRQMMTA